MSWQLAHVYIPAPYNAPGMSARLTETVIARLVGPEGVTTALEAGWLQEVRRHRDGYRRFAVQLTDQRHYQPVTVTFLLAYHGTLLR